MRTVVGDEEFNYVLLCNKVCGSAHYNMQMTIIVETEDKYQEWLSQQKTFVKDDNAATKTAEEEVGEIVEERKIAVNN